MLYFIDSRTDNVYDMLNQSSSQRHLYVDNYILHKCKCIEHFICGQNTITTTADGHRVSPPGNRRRWRWADELDEY